MLREEESKNDLLVIRWGNPENVPHGEDMLQYAGEGWRVELPIFHSRVAFA